MDVLKEHSFIISIVVCCAIWGIWDVTSKSFEYITDKIENQRRLEKKRREAEEAELDARIRAARNILGN